MAYLVFSDRKTDQVDAVKGRHVWQVLKGQAEPDDDKDTEYCARVHKIYLNYYNAPDDYIRERFDIIAPMVIGRWMVRAFKSESGQHTSDGVPTLPEPGDTWNWKFSEKWGLIKDGRATDLARKYF